MRLGAPQPQTVVVLVLFAATLVMPVSYRAGADHAHAHTIIQGIIDTIVGHPHHHGDHAHEPSAQLGSPFAPTGPSLSVYAGPEDVNRQAEDVTPELDPPERLGLSMPISAAAAVQALGMLVAALLGGACRRPLWHEARRLLNRTVGVETPPPRPV